MTPSPGDPQACECLASHSRALAMPPSRAPRPAPRAPSQGHRAPAEARERGYGPAPLTIAVVVLHGAGDRLRTPGPRPPLTSHSPSPLRHQLASDKLRAPEPRPPRRARTAQHTPAHAPLAAPPPAQDPAHNKSARAQTPSQRPPHLAAFGWYLRMHSLYDPALNHAFASKYRLSYSPRGGAEFRVSSFTIVRRPRAGRADLAHSPATPVITEAQGHGCHGRVGGPS